MAKTQLRFKKEYAKMSIEEVAHDLWKQNKVDLSTTGQGARMDEKMFTHALKTHYKDALEHYKANGNSIRKATRNAIIDAIKSYDRSATYRDKADRYSTFKICDLFGGTPNAMSRTFQQRVRNKRGHYEKYDPNKLLFSHVGYDSDGKKYAEYTYTASAGGMKTILRSYNSPQEWKLYDEEGTEIDIK